MKYYNRYLEATNLNSIGKFTKSLEIFRSLYNEEPENDLINYGIAYTLLNKEKDIEKKPEIEHQIREHIKKSQLLGIILLGELEERLGNIEKARKQYKKAIKFDNKPDAFYHLIALEEKLGNINEAKECYTMFLESIKNDFKDNGNVDKPSIFLLGKSALEMEDYGVAKDIFNYLINSEKYIQSSIKCLIVIDIKTKNYEEAYKKVPLLDDSNNFEEEPLFLFLIHKLGYLYREYPTKKSYYKNQLLNYRRKRAIHSIIKGNKDKFLDCVDPALMFHICNRNIKGLAPIKKYGYIDKYHIDFTSNIGNVHGNLTNRVSVTTIADTKRILTIYPTINEHNKEKCNLVSDEEKETKKVKTKSQIEKFNSKYNLQ